MKGRLWYLLGFSTSDPMDAYSNSEINHAAMRELWRLFGLFKNQIQFS